MKTPVLTIVGETEQGYSIYVEPNEAGGKRYWSDEVGEGVIVWDTSLVAPESVMLALEAEGYPSGRLLAFCTGSIVGAITTSTVVLVSWLI